MQGPIARAGLGIHALQAAMQRASIPENIPASQVECFVLQVNLKGNTRIWKQFVGEIAQHPEVSEATRVHLENELNRRQTEAEGGRR